MGTEERQAIQAEINEIRTEIDRTATQTEFNGRQLLEGSSGGANAVEITSGIEGETVDIDVADVRSAELGLDNIDVTTQAGAQAAIATTQGVERTLRRILPSKKPVAAPWSVHVRRSDGTLVPMSAAEVRAR